ncbi:putative enzyme, Dienelactone hydrolase family [Cupriavidus taiwanensis]|uniref:dienelactone hydrolase family protein n=1 Tax=Cupriavidus taiwanensis TaxID=164546 RepID=UPI000E178EEB|nr:dienelactone hydrolase family protein [Cupriavidus taiwanensis]SOZ14731.1 putative enzyme, Dienelactone hydrolase family [Cupriavidus taiwanensis]SOZ26517.1 putative enzyme, Dienelactone hydrolase family [Cupriavidus taiwanensis]SOZ45305.1 putative enzyme, Dienelactone hydrolase family [Cupriavidus taiwanensis]
MVHAPATPQHAPRAARPAGAWLRAAVALGIGAWLTGAAAHTPDLPAPALDAPPPLTPAGALAPNAVSRAVPAQRVQLRGDAATPALTAYWFLPREGATPRALPVVVALHGCGGLLAPRATRDASAAATGSDAADVAALLQQRYREYAHWLTERGYAVLMPDSFSARGKPHGICAEPIDNRAIDDRTRRADALAALRWVAQQPAVDAARIVLLGWSNGAQAVLATVDASRPWPAGTPQVERAVAFYPGCKRAVQQHSFRLRSPLLLMIGGADDWTPATRCAMLQSAVQARQPGARFRLEIFPGAYHGFDGTSELHRRTDVPAAAMRKSQSVTVGGDAVARVAALAQLDSWLASPDP